MSAKNIRRSQRSLRHEDLWLRRIRAKENGCSRI